MWASQELKHKLSWILLATNEYTYPQIPTAGTNRSLQEVE